MLQIKIKKVLKICIALSLILLTQVVNGQDTSKIYFTTSIGKLMPLGNFSNAYKNSVALNSGIELKISKNNFIQFELDFNAVNYDQQYIDTKSNYLFQQTSSSVFLVGLNGGKNIFLNKKNNAFVSPYIGVGYVNIGEPRLAFDNTKNIITQTVERMQGIYGRSGLRIAYNTNSKLLQTIYIDASYWISNVEVQQSKAQAVSILVGTRIGF